MSDILDFTCGGEDSQFSLWVIPSVTSGSCKNVIIFHSESLSSPKGKIDFTDQ